MKFWLILNVLFVAMGVPVGTSAQQMDSIVLRDAPAESVMFKKTSNSTDISKIISPEPPKTDCFPSYSVVPKDVENLAKENPGHCWFLKTPIVYESYKDRDVLENDMVICKCLDKSKNTAVQALMDDNQFPDEKLTTVQRFKKSADKLEHDLTRDRESLAFQAKNISDKEEFFGPFGAKSKSSKAISGILKNNLSKILDNASKSVGSSSLSPADKAAVLNIVHGFKIPPRTNSKLFSETKLEANQCVSGRDFLLMKQLPHEKVNDELKQLSKKAFSEADWSYDSLRSQFDVLMKYDLDKKKEHKEEILSVRSKLRFLDRNPLFKTLLSVDSKLSLLDDLPDSKKKQKLVADAPALKAALLTKKKDLMTILSNFAQDNNLDAYNDSLKKFFVDDKVSRIMDLAIEVNAQKKLESITSPKNFEEKKSDIRSKNALYAKFSLSTGLKSPETCSRNNRDNHGNCVEIFSAYCRQLEKVLPKVSADSEGWMYDDLDLLSENDANPNIDSNSDLLAFNEMFCKDFNAYRNEQCQKNKQYNCQSTDPETIRLQRLDFLKNRKPSNNKAYEYDVSLLSQISRKRTSNSNVPSNIDSDDSSSNGFAGFESLRQEWGAENFRPRSNWTGPLADAGEADGVSQNFMASNQAFANNIDPNQALMNPSSSNYQSSYTSSPDHEQRIENMTTDQKRDLLNDWKKEYEDLSEKKTSAGSRAETGEESALKDRISALEQLLKDQKKLTDDQYKLLNQSIAAKTTSKEDSAEKNTTVTPKAAATPSSVTNESVVDSGRSPASISDGMSQKTMSNGGSSTGPSTVERRVIFNPDSSAESIAREEAKLVNLRNNADGSLTIEAVKNGSNSGNAITLPVTDEQYKILQTNPDALNLAQLEQKIPKDQIEKLQKNGQIIILLRNGANPPFEVKVEKKNNKLVYRLRDDQGRPQNPVRRVNTLQALGLQFKNQ